MIDGKMLKLKRRVSCKQLWMLVWDSYTVEPRSVIFQGDGEKKRWMQEND